jgi:hypothetical protein
MRGMTFLQIGVWLECSSKQPQPQPQTAYPVPTHTDGYAVRPFTIISMAINVKWPATTQSKTSEDAERLKR